MPSAATPATTPAKTASPPTAATQTSAVDMAPQGTWGVFVLDVAKVLSVPDIRDKVAKSFPAGLNPGWIKQLTIFAVPSANGAAPGGAAVVSLAAGAGPQLEAWLKSNGTPVTVGGATAYKVNLGSAPSGGAGGMAGGPAMAGPVSAPQSALVTVVNDTTALSADDQQALGALLTASKNGGGVSPELKKFLGEYSGATVYGAVLASPEIMAHLQGPDTAGLKGGALKVNLGSTYDITAAGRFTTAQQAQKAVADAQSGIGKMKQQAAAAPNPQTAAMMKPMVDLVSKLNVKAQGSDAIFSIQLTKQDIAELAKMLPMLMMGAGGGMAGPPGATMTPMPSGNP